MQYQVNKDWSKWSPGQVIDESELPEGLDVARSIRRGTITPLDAGFEAPLSDTDAAGWKRRAEALELANMELRTATPEAGKVAELADLRKEHEALKAEHEGAKTALAQFEEGSVPRADHVNLQQAHAALEQRYDEAVKELEALKAKKSAASK